MAEISSNSEGPDACEGATARLLTFVDALRWKRLEPEVRHAAKRHVIDTIGVIIAGSASDVATKMESVVAAVRPAGCVPVPGRARRADILDAASLGGTAGHGLELDDGYRLGSVHPGVAVVPATLSAAYGNGVSGKELLEAIVAGYEVITAIAAFCHPKMRRRGFHPTGVVGSLGAAVAAGRALKLNPGQTASAFGLAASSSAGLFAFLGGGADVKRLHAGHAAREGLLAALLARGGVSGPPNVLEARDGVFQAFAYGESEKLPPLELSSRHPGIADCYVKPYACCRHLQPAVEALMSLREEHQFREEQVLGIEIETYSIAAEHAKTGWHDFASAQLSFPFIMALGLRYGRIDLAGFNEAVRMDSGIRSICERVRVSVCPDLDKAYPEKRPARVQVQLSDRTLTKQVDEALGSRTYPLSDQGLGEKFIDLVAPIMGSDTASNLLDRLWALEEMPDVTPLIENLARPDQ